MRITNKFNRPSAFYNLALEEADHKFTPKQYSVTTLLKPIRMIMLERRHNDEIETDVKSMTRALFGQAIHYVLQHHDKTEWAEKELKYTLDNGYTISARIDAFDEKEYKLIDYKTCKIYKLANTNDFYLQGLMYAFILRKKGYYCNKAEFWAFLLDWSESLVDKKKGYPQSDNEPINYEFNESNFETIGYWINQRMEAIIEVENLPDNELPLCTQEERWKDDLRCKRYCSCKEFCPYYKEKYGNKTLEEIKESEE